MLVKFMDKSDQPVWVNPLHVKYLQPKSKGTMIVMGPTLFLKVTASPEEAAEAISAALPDQVVLMPAEDDQDASPGG